jgi:hypothetical protein
MISYVGIEAHMQQMNQLDKVIDQTIYSINSSTGLPYAAGFVQMADGTGLRTFAMIPPTGTITLYGGASAPSGWLQCNGTTALKATYPSLFAVIGSRYGAVTDTTFTLPGTTQLPTIPGAVSIYIIKD